MWPWHVQDKLRNAVARPGLTSGERRQLADLVKRAFWHFGARRCEPSGWMSPEDADRTDTLIRRFGQTFAKIILSGDSVLEAHVDLTKLGVDLLKFLKQGCPVLDIVELSLVCTSGATTLDDTLRMVGVTGRDLDRLRKHALEIADIVCRMLKPSPLGGPSLLLPVRLPEEVSKRIRQVEGLPWLLMLLVKVIDNYPHQKLSRKNKEFLRDKPLALLYLLLNHFGSRFGYPTTSALLRTMQRVRQIVVPDATYLHSLSFEEHAVTKRVERFFEIEGKPQAPETRNKFQKLVEVYLSDEFAEQRKRGKTVLLLFGQLWLKMPE